MQTKPDKDNLLKFDHNHQQLALQKIISPLHACTFNITHVILLLIMWAQTNMVEQTWVKQKES